MRKQNFKKPNDRPYKCPCCNEEINESFLLHHNLSPTHVFNYYMWSFQEKRQRLVKDKEGIGLRLTPINLSQIGLNMEFKKKKGKYSLQLDLNDLKAIQNTLQFRCTVLNDRKENSIFLTAACILDAYPWATCFDDKTKWMQSREFVRIRPKQKYDGVVIQFQMRNVVAGSFQIPFAVNLQSETDENSVTISRTIRVIVVDEKVAEPINEDKQKSPFTDFQWATEIKWLVPPHRRLFQMNNYQIPTKYEEHFRNNLRVWKGMKSNEVEVLELLKDQMKPGYVTKENYKAFFHNCLWLEEQTNALMLNKYNMENVFMNIYGQADLRLQVPGLAEKRPSLIIGDMILIRVHDDHTGYEGYIRTVEDNHVIINYVDEELLQTVYEMPNIPLDVAFKLGRLPYERAHEGIDKVCLNGTLKSLFPDQLPPYSYKEIVPIQEDEFVNKSIFGNLEQRTAVEKIVNRSSGLAPYIVFGPPGTGKTVTIVEAIVQILRRTKKKILICAPANAACDMLASKLIPYCSKKELIGVHSESRDSSTIPREVLAYSNTTASGVFMKIAPKQLNRYRIVVSTLILIGKFGNTDEYKPDILFVDEAAQALETDVCVPLGVMKNDAQIVLAGDPKQLGPIVQSTPAQEFGLNKSLLERLMETQKVYEKHANPNYITMLKKNFRSHSTILEIPNKLFYNCQLEAIAERPIQDPLAKYSIYPTILSRNDIKQKDGFVPGQAMEFCAVSAKEQREGRSPSYFNPAEANMVMQYIKTLISMKLGPENDVKPSDIGVITPYIRQVYKIKGLLKANNLKDVEVGSTEAFQGREKRVIIISTVRAQNDLLQHDKKYSLGFVKQEKRFNVAITRAISKLVVVGCPAVLSTDTKWTNYMEQCRDLNTYFGAPYVERTEENMAEMVERFKNFPAFNPPKK